MKKKPRRRWFTFKFQLTVEQLCYPNQAQKMHDKLQRDTAQALADYLDETLTMSDCKTGKFKGSVRPRRR